jgi:uncharacterized OB-fold protein
MEEHRFFDKEAHVRTFTMDGLSLSMDPPNILVVLEFEGGGKLMTYLVDCRKEDVHVGMEVRPTFRRMFQANGVSTYFWKVVPAEEVRACAVLQTESASSAWAALGSASGSIPAVRI